MKINHFLLIGGFIISLHEVKTYATEPLCQTPVPIPGIDRLSVLLENCEGKPGGAWFYKVESSESQDNKGIAAKVTLPTFEHDPSRIFENSNKQHGEHTEGPLDRPSVYLGGSIGGSELDAGLTWDKVFKNGKATKEFSFRPFWRFKEKGKQDTTWRNPRISPQDKRLEADTCPRNPKEIHDNCSPENKSFVGGKSVDMELKEVKRSEDGKTSTIMMRIKQGNTCFKACFKQSRGEPKVGNTWKRVNSIDQFKVGKCYVAGYKTLKEESTRSNKLQCEVPEIKNYNGKRVKEIKTVPCDEILTISPVDDKGNAYKESKQFTGPYDCRGGNEKESVIPTNAKITETNWEKVSLFKKDGTIPLNSKNSEVILGKEFCGIKKLSKEKHFEATDINEKSGGQTIQIIPKFD